MKRLILTLAAVASVAGPMAAMATDASAQGWQHGGDRHDDGGRDRHDGGRDRQDDRGHDRYDNRGRDFDRRGDDHRGWDNNRHNGYYLGSRFYYGPPPAAYYGRSDYRPGYTHWSRGGYLPRYYWGSSYVVSDYGRYGLRRPPYGYRWYNVNGDYVLAALAGGLIADALTH